MPPPSPRIRSPSGSPADRLDSRRRPAFHPSPWAALKKMDLDLRVLHLERDGLRPFFVLLPAFGELLEPLVMLQFLAGNLRRTSPCRRDSLSAPHSSYRNGVRSSRCSEQFPTRSNVLPWKSFSFPISVFLHHPIGCHSGLTSRNTHRFAGNQTNNTHIEISPGSADTLEPSILFLPNFARKLKVNVVL